MTTRHAVSASNCIVLAHIHTPRMNFNTNTESVRDTWTRKRLTVAMVMLMVSTLKIRQNSRHQEAEIVWIS